MQTPSAARSLAVNGNLAYLCDDNEVSVIDVTSPANPVFLGGVLASDIKNDGVAYCAIGSEERRVRMKHSMVMMKRMKIACTSRRTR